MQLRLDVCVSIIYANISISAFLICRLSNGNCTWLCVPQAYKTHGSELCSPRNWSACSDVLLRPLNSQCKNSCKSCLRTNMQWQYIKTQKRCQEFCVCIMMCNFCTTLLYYSKQYSITVFPGVHLFDIHVKFHWPLIHSLIHPLPHSLQLQGYRPFKTSKQ